MRILVVEDETRVASFIAKGFQEEGYAADVVHDGESGLHQALMFDYDVVVLDVMLPKRSGFDIVREVRAKKARLPIILLTAKDDVDSRIAGLNLGADDYLVKPFAFGELLARVRALQRRGMPESTRLTYADVEMDSTTRTIFRAGKKIDLRLKEYALLEFLMRNAGRPVTRTMIVEHVWDIHHDSMSNIVDVHINALRSKIDKDFSPPLIHTVRGVGYLFSKEAP